MSHTPGPWQALPPDEHYARWMISQVPPARNAAPFYIGTVFTETLPYASLDAAANAHLIAAAPELYTELQKARDNLAMIVREGLMLKYYDFTSMDAAIAKVERAREGIE